MSRPLAAALSILFLFGISCPAQQAVSADVDDFINAEMRRQRIPGLSLAVIKHGQVILTKGYGLANVEHRVPVTPQTVFQSGSMGKQFTATAVMSLVEEGKLSLDDEIVKYFSDAPQSWKDITVRHLLTHTSGLGDYPPDFDLRRDYTEDELLAAIKSVSLNFSAGEGWDYSNLGFVLLGILIRRVTGKFYGDYLAERVFKPLGMTEARVISESDIVPHRAAGYRLAGGELKNQEWVSPSMNTTADGSLYLTVLDMVKWDAALRTGRLLKPPTLEQMWRPVSIGGGRSRPYGFGWHTDVMRGHRVVHHGGAWQGFKSYIVRLPDDKLTIVFFVNLWQANEFRIARGLMAIFRPEFALSAARPIEDREPQVTALVKKVLRQFSTGTADFKLFTAGARVAVFPQRATQIGDSLNSLSLAVAVISSSLDLVDRREEGDLRVYRYVLTDIGRTLFCTIKLTKDDKIADLQLRED
ncbi:MAG TPA: serine hydrolase domain-containing protein [Pyrinomonadaceae bacterium]|nr:serine hydrolase domain-containing protein [Pyrinomonadaceae bacterium]